LSGFLDFVLERLPRAPARVLEVGCGDEGGLVPALAELGYDVLGADPRAPKGPRYVRATIAELDESDRFAAVVASRVLHHVRPLDDGIARIAGLAPLLLVDEFAPERIDDDARAWYAAQHRVLVAAGAEPPGPSDLVEWAARHPDLHPSQLVLAELARRFETQSLEWRPYLYRWLGGPASEELERALVGVGALPALGFRYAGVRTETTRPSAEPR
jgi:hypothetical protein